MTEETQNNQVSQSQAEPTQAQLNFRALENKYKRQLEEEKQARLIAEKRAQELEQMRSQHPVSYTHLNHSV